MYGQFDHTLFDYFKEPVYKLLHVKYPIKKVQVSFKKVVNIVKFLNFVENFCFCCISTSLVQKIVIH